MAANIPSTSMVEDVCDIMAYVGGGSIVDRAELLTEKCKMVQELLTQQEAKYNAAMGDLDMAKKDKEEQMNRLAELQSDCHQLTQQNHQKILEVKLGEETLKKAEEYLRSAAATMAVLTAQNREMNMQLEALKQSQDVDNEEGATSTTQAKNPIVKRVEMPSMAETSAKVIAKKEERISMEFRGSTKKQKALKKAATFLNENNNGKTNARPSERREEVNPFGEGNRVPPGLPASHAAIRLDNPLEVFERMSIEDIKKCRAKYMKKGC